MSVHQIVSIQNQILYIQNVYIFPGYRTHNITGVMHKSVVVIRSILQTRALWCILRWTNWIFLVSELVSCISFGQCVLFSSLNSIDLIVRYETLGPDSWDLILAWRLPPPWHDDRPLKVKPVCCVKHQAIADTVKRTQHHDCRQKDWFLKLV